VRERQRESTCGQPSSAASESDSVGSPPSLDLDMYFSESIDLPGWWRAAIPVGVTSRREREESESESETEYQRERQERREFWAFFL
jgi:hypothetical protein